MGRNPDRSRPVILSCRSFPRFRHALPALLLAGAALAPRAAAQAPLLPPVALSPSPEIVIGCAFPLSGEDAAAGGAGAQAACRSRC
jgi:hypothetical protein